MELFRRTLAGLLMLVVAVSVGIWVQGRFIDAVRLPTHTRMIGATYTTLSDPFYETINDEIQMQIKSNGDLLLVRDPGQDQERQNQEIEDMLNKGIELLIVNPVDYVGVTPALEKAREKGVPVILIDSKVDDPELVTCTITSNNYGAGLLDARHLISQTKNARIVLLSNSDSFSSWDRLSGFCQTLTKSGNDYRILELRDCGGELNRAMRAMVQLLETFPRIDVVMAVNEQAALGAMAALEEKGRALVHFGLQRGRLTGGESPDLRRADDGHFGTVAPPHRPDDGRGGVRDPGGQAVPDQHRGAGKSNHAGGYSALRHGGLAMKTENLSIGLRVLYHAIEWLTVFLILLIFAVQIITPLYAVRVGRADSFLQQLQWLPYRPGVLALGVMLAAVGTILSKCSHEVDSGFLSRSSWQLYLLEGVLYSASALIFQQNCDKIALFAIVDMVDDPRSLRQKRFLSAMIVVYLFCNMDAATSALHAVTLKQYLAFYSLHTRSVLQLVIESLSALEMILFILYMVLFISQQTSEKQEILNLNQQLQQANEQLRIYAEESAHTAQVQERNRLAREIHDTLGHVLTGITAGADACIQMMDDSPEMARHQMELIADTARNGMNDVRRSVKALRPDSLEKENLSGALNKMCTSMAQSSGAQIQLEESLAGLTLSQDEEDCVYRTVQEGITNAIRHGHATRVQVRCHIEDGVLEVSVKDNGIGCKSVTPGFGLQHMQERMLMLGGTFWYENSDGFCIRAEIPLRKTPGSEKRKQEETV